MFCSVFKKDRAALFSVRATQPALAAGPERNLASISVKAGMFDVPKQKFRSMREKPKRQ